MRDELIENLHAEIYALTLQSMKLFDVMLFKEPVRPKLILNELAQYASEPNESDPGFRNASHLAAPVKVLRTIEIHHNSAMEADDVLRRTMVTLSRPSSTE
ncbi:hypothetical protein RA224_09260 [Achromobacter aegrifaciens]|uniref:hypothetical protein n=1 Tax=Achromobacter aegrifaciens TaxID=1287736 RepID=UPI0027BA7E6C|nr:hypothetical protein [Achromobacter aegrifaciens]WLW63591.1 hypothetical protein RA224_09260 [Achromobacter aegrifaciens]